MKKSIYILSILFLVLNAGCRKPLKDVNDYFPVIKTVSAVVQDDGSVLVTGEIESEGKTKDAVIKYVGFCLSTNSEPQMLEKQLIADLNGTSFTGIYAGSLFKIDSIYYFRSWGTNRYGYSYGNIIALDSIIAIPITPPCTLAMNMVNIGGSQPTAYYDNVSTPDATNTITASSSSGPSATFKFGSSLTTGIYKTTENTSPSAGQVFVSFYYQFISGALNSGSKVYVKRVNSTSFEISICDAPWTYGSSTLYFNTHFITP
jgi:hypothetical protein